MWLDAGTGNSNFFYNQNLGLIVFNSLLILEFTSVSVSRRKRLTAAAKRWRRGVGPLPFPLEEKDGTKAKAASTDREKKEEEEKQGAKGKKGSLLIRAEQSPKRREQEAGNC